MNNDANSVYVFEVGFCKFIVNVLVGVVHNTDQVIPPTMAHQIKCMQKIIMI